MKKIVIFVLIISVIGTIFIAKRHHDNMQEWKQNREIKTITVCDGEGLDTYGMRYCPHWMDIREYRYEIEELNNLDSAMIYAGQELKVYVEGGI